MVRDLRGIRPEYYKLLPILCIHESNELEPILAKECNMALGDIAQAIVPASVIPTCLEAITQVSKSSSWRARASILELLQVSSVIKNQHKYTLCLFDNKMQCRLLRKQNLNKIFSVDHVQTWAP